MPAPEALDRALIAGDVACLIVDPAGATSPGRLAEVRTLLRLAQARDVAALVVGEPALARELKADGVHLAAQPDPDACAAAVKNARRLLGSDASIGASAGLSRHRAMVAGEAGADYVAFEADDGDLAALAEMVDWWAELFEVPSLVLGAFEADVVRALASAGADFIAIEAGAGEPAVQVAAAEAALQHAGTGSGEAE